MSVDGHKQALPTGFHLGSHRVVRVLGVGGFGVTYLCEHTGLGVQVAVKEYLPNEIAVRDGTEVHPKSAGDREGFEWGVARFLDEARTLSRFEHPNVVRVRGCFEANNTAYIVMDYQDGESLDRLLQRLGTLTERQLRQVVLPVADGLRQVHAAGFLHRDIKPSNIFVRRADGSPVLLDFGSARQALGRRSRSMTAIASAGYSPPEQYESKGEQGAWTDIYALSALCHRAITGRAPVDALRRTGELARSRPDPQAKLVASEYMRFSSGLLESVDWGLRVTETERPQSLDDWLARIEEPRSAHEATRLAAEQGSAVAQRRLGDMYDNGEGVPKDAREAARWYRKAAEQGDAEAQMSLGALHWSKDPSATMLWYRKAAEQGLAEAQFRLARHLSLVGFALHQGSEVAIAQEVAQWYRRAAEEGHAEAQHDLGLMYAEGRDVPIDKGRAWHWLRKAAEQGLAEAQYDLGRLLTSVVEDTPTDVKTYQQPLFQNSSSFLVGENTPTGVEAYAWCSLAAAQGQAHAVNEIARLERRMNPARIAEAQKFSVELIKSLAEVRLASG